MAPGEDQALPVLSEPLRRQHCPKASPLPCLLGRVSRKGCLALPNAEFPLFAYNNGVVMTSCRELDNSRSALSAASAFAIATAGANEGTPTKEKYRRMSLASAGETEMGGGLFGGGALPHWAETLLPLLNALLSPLSPRLLPGLAKEEGGRVGEGALPMLQPTRPSSSSSSSSAPVPSHLSCSRARRKRGWWYITKWWWELLGARRPGPSPEYWLLRNV